jgi:hypothetical protein
MQLFFGSTFPNSGESVKPPPGPTLLGGIYLLQFDLEPIVAFQAMKNWVDRAAL